MGGEPAIAGLLILRLDWHPVQTSERGQNQDLAGHMEETITRNGAEQGDFVRGFEELVIEVGGAERDRTAGLLVANEALSQLSYSPTNFL